VARKLLAVVLTGVALFVVAKQRVPLGD